jgi:hypothetical protein
VCVVWVCGCVGVCSILVALNAYNEVFRPYALCRGILWP